VITLDTSVVVPALIGWHEHHEIARPQLDRDAWVAPQTILESYAVMTRLPQPRRLTARTASELLGSWFHRRTLVVRRWNQMAAVDTLAAAGVTGGAAYDGLIALFAKAAGATVVSLDRRAAATYRALEVDYELLGSATP
jgi:predicted nucleic acid-binding protein